MVPLKVGSYVLLKDMFLPSRDWPILNSFYEIPGIVQALKNQESDVDVLWANGATNRYGIESLNLMSNEDFNNRVYMETTLGIAIHRLSEYRSIPEDRLTKYGALLFDRVEYIVNAAGNSRIYIHPDYTLDNSLSPVKLIIELNNLTYKSIW